MGSQLNHQALRLYAMFSEMIRKCQCRDRDQICCHGLSVSQCHCLEALAQRDSMTMGDLAAHLGLKISSMTRVVDALVAAGLARRTDDRADRRVCRIRISPKGKALVGRIQGGLVEEYKHILRSVAPQAREAVLRALADLLSALQERCCRDH